IVNTGSAPLTSLSLSLLDGGNTIFSTGSATGSGWSSVFGNEAWHGQGATEYTQTISVSPGIYQVAVDWLNLCGPGMSAITYSGAEPLSNWYGYASNTFSVTDYAEVLENPLDPADFGAIIATGSFPTAEYAYGTPSYQGNTYLGFVVQPFPAPFTALNNNNVPCGSQGPGYAMSTYMVFSSSVTFNIVTDDAMAVFYQPAVIAPGQSLSLSFVIPSGVSIGGTYSVEFVASTPSSGPIAILQGVTAQ
ncbi:MAG: hypothetical protein QW658_02400, partial [Candidatus Bathyarchaeia archaeon]